MNITPTGYTMIRGTLTNVKKAVLKMDVSDIEEMDLDPQVMYLTDTVFFLWFDKFRDRTRIYDRDELPYTPKATPGVLLKSIGVKNKRQMLQQCRADESDFWHYAHIQEYPLFAGVSVKVELLPQRKIDLDDPRVFDPMDGIFCLSADRVSRHLNDLIKEDSDILVGFVKQFGGFQRLAEEFTHAPWLTMLREGDAKKWDASMRKYLFDRIKLCRYIAFNEYTRNYFETPLQGQYKTISFGNHKYQVNYVGGLWRRIDYYYEKGIVGTYLIMPNGQVLVKRHSNPSGSPNTTPDNCFGHEWIIIYSVISCAVQFWQYDKTVMEELNTDPYTFVNKLVKKKIYSDDHLIGIFQGFEQIYTLTIAAQGYGKCGIELDVTRSMDQLDIIGHTLLGSTFQKFEYFNKTYIVPVPDGQKGICSIARYGKRTSLDQIYTVACAHEIEQTFGEYHSLFSGLCDHLEKCGAQFNTQVDFEPILGFRLTTRMRSRDRRIRFLLGLETNSFPSEPKKGGFTA